VLPEVEVLYPRIEGCGVCRGDQMEAVPLTSGLEVYPSLADAISSSIREHREGLDREL